MDVYHVLPEQFVVVLAGVPVYRRSAAARLR
jgi:hypothetical protein